MGKLTLYYIRAMGECSGGRVRDGEGLELMYRRTSGIDCVRGISRKCCGRTGRATSNQGRQQNCLKIDTFLLQKYTAPIPIPTPHSLKADH